MTASGLRLPAGLLVALLAGFLAGGPASAQAGTNAVAGAVPPEGAAPPEVVPRDPFWPVGWKPPPPRKASDPIRSVTPDVPPTVAEPQLKWDEALRTLRLAGTTYFAARDKYIATVRGIGPVEEGDIIRVEFERVAYRWRVVSITKGEFKTVRLDAVPLR